MNGEQLLARAATTLREHTDAGWVALRDDIVATASRAFRPSAPVRGRLLAAGHSRAELWVASTVLVSQVRSAVAGVAGAGARRILCATTANHELDVLTVEIVALYGTPLVPLAQEVRRVAANAVAETLGLISPPVDRIVVDVSISDVADDPDGL